MAVEVQNDALSGLMADFGISYPNAPRPSPALLAFTRGLGMNLDEAEDRSTKQIGRTKRRASDARSDLRRSSARGKENVTADLLRRGIHSSGEANTRYARQAEDVGAAESDIARTEAEGIGAAEDAFQQIGGQLRTGAMETVLGEETRQSTQKAVADATEDSWKRREAADEAAYQRSKAEQDKRAAEEEAMTRKIYNLPPRAS